MHKVCKNVDRLVETCFQLKSQATVCRDATGRDCDVEEYCNGNDYLCPPDIHKRDGINCTVNGVREIEYICIKSVPQDDVSPDFD